MLPHDDAGNRLTRIIASRRWSWAIVLTAFLLSGLMIGAVGEAGNETDARYLLPDDADSTSAAWQVDDLPQESSEAAIVLWTADEGRLGRARSTRSRLGSPTRRRASSSPPRTAPRCSPSSRSTAETPESSARRSTISANS